MSEVFDEAKEASIIYAECLQDLLDEDVIAGLVNFINLSIFVASRIEGEGRVRFVTILSRELEHLGAEIFEDGLDLLTHVQSRGEIDA